MLKFKSILMVTLLGLTTPAMAATTEGVPDNLAQEVPKGWHVFDVVSGDLNQDEITDYIIVIEKDTAEPHKLQRLFPLDIPPYINSHEMEIWESKAAPRKMWVFDGQADGTFIQTLSHSDWIERGDFNEGIGDTYDSIRIDGDAIWIFSHGGSRVAWQRELRIRHEADGWRMLQLNEYVYDNDTSKSESYRRNLVDYKIQIQREENNSETEKYTDEISDKTKIYLSNEVN